MTRRVRDDGWRALLAEHSAAVEAYADAAERVPPDRWRRPPAEGHWSAAEITMHLFLASEAALRELAGGPPMRPRLRRWWQPLARWRYLRRILRGGGFPSGVRAPRETRPGDRLLDAPEAIALFRQRAAELERAIDDARTRRAGPVLTHPHFGRLKPEKALGLVTAHVRHHLTQLERTRSLH